MDLIKEDCVCSKHNQEQLMHNLWVFCIFFSKITRSIWLPRVPCILFLLQTNYCPIRYSKNQFIYLQFPLLLYICIIGLSTLPVACLHLPIFRVTQASPSSSDHGYPYLEHFLSDYLKSVINISYIDCHRENITKTLQNEPLA